MRALLIACLFVATPAFAQAPHTYSISWFTQTVSDFEASMVWEEAPDGANRFAAFHFPLAGGDGGYAGLQQLADGSLKAIFSIWGGTPVASTCGYVTELGEQVSRCLIDYPWEFGERYTFRVGKVGTMRNGHWYAAWVEDEDGLSTLIGVHAVPLTVTGIGPWIIDFMELFGESECMGHERTVVAFSPPVGQSGTVLDDPIYRDHWSSCEEGQAEEAYLHESGE